MYTICKEGRFEASHILEGHKGACGRLHGHSYRFQVELKGITLNEIGLLFDFTDLPIKNIEEAYDHQHLNNVTHSVLKLRRTSAECIAETIWHYMFGFLDTLYQKESWRFADLSVGVSKVTVWETAKCWASYEQS